MTFINRFREPSTWAGLGGLSLAIPGVVGAGSEKAQIAAEGAQMVATGLSGGLGLIPSILLAFASSLSIALRERGERDE